jgi:hypothetical protein
VNSEKSRRDGKILERKNSKTKNPEGMTGL